MKFLIFISILIVTLQICQTFQFKFDKVACNVSDEKLVKFETCILKAVSRNEQYIKVYAKVLQKSLKDIQMRFQFLTKANGWKPFLYDVPIKCDGPRKLNPVTKIIWTLINDLTNFNNSCLLNHDVEIYATNAYVSTTPFKGLPIPNGAYRLIIYLKVTGKLRSFLDVYGTVY